MECRCVELTKCSIKFKNISIIDINMIRSLILNYVDLKSLNSLELVCKKWKSMFTNCVRWRYFLIHIVEGSIILKNISHIYEWNQYLYYDYTQLPPEYYRETIHKCIEIIKKLKYPFMYKLVDPKQINLNIRDQNSKILCFACSFKKIYVGQKNSEITVWNIETGDFEEEYLGHTDSVYEIIADHDLIVSCSNDKTLRLWSIDHNYCLDVVNHFHQSPTNISFRFNTVFAYFQELNIIHGWTIHAERFNQNPWTITLPEATDIHKNILEMKNDYKYLITRSNSQFIRMWETDNLSNYKSINNEEEIICMDLRYGHIITCDVKYFIRIFDTSLEIKLKYGLMLNQGIRTICALSSVILFGGNDGNIQKICFEKNDNRYEYIDLIDKEYFKIKEGTERIKIHKKKIICLTSMNSIKIINTHDRIHESVEFWKPDYIRELN